jgi:hypothetical protein
MSWLKKHWRTLAKLIIGASMGLAADRTIVARYAPVADQVVNAIPCTPGESGCTSPAPVKP